MTSKHYAWHKHWRRVEGGHMQHSSGLRVIVTHDDGATDLEADEATLAAYQAHERGRGVPTHDLIARLRRLMKEAAEWHPRNP